MIILGFNSNIYWMPAMCQPVRNEGYEDEEEEEESLLQRPGRPTAEDRHQNSVIFCLKYWNSNL